MSESEWKKRAEDLWTLLDHIDTLDDACKDSDSGFRECSRKYLRQRFDILTSDGYTLSVPPAYDREVGA